MKWGCLVLALAAFVAGAHAAAGDVNQECDTGDTCTDPNAYCDTTVPTSKKCKCNTQWFAKGTKCVRGAGLLCDKGMCYTGLVCDTGACMCDTSTKGYSVGTNGTTSCSCPSGMTDTYGNCEKKIGESGCTSDVPCVTTTGAYCNAGTCACQTSQFRTANAANTACDCDSSKAVDESGTCKLKLGQTGCSSASDCVTTTGVECANVGGSMTCQCSSSSNRAANVANTQCECGSDYTEENGVCKLKLSKTTCATASDCVSTTGVQCTDVGGTMTCGCDSALNRVADALLTSCECDTDYTEDNGVCKLKLSKTTCATASDCVSTTGVQCTDVGGTLTCGCDSALNRVANTPLTSCVCDTDYTEDSGVCKLKLTKSTCATASDCVTTTGVECADIGGTMTCGCSSASNRVADTLFTSCECDSSKTVDESGTCKMKLGQSCSSASDCVTTTGVECSGGTCGCSSSSNRVANAANTACECDSSKAVDESGTCKLKGGQTCSATEDCVTTDGMVCADSTCKCNTTANWAASSAGATSCSCGSDYTEENNVCVLRVGKTCGDDTPACVYGSLCDKATSTCKCDEANNFATGSVGAASCSCASSATSVTIDGKAYCVSKIGGPCTLKTDADVCKSGTSCKETKWGSTNVHACVCGSGTAQADGTCSGAGGVVVSVLSLLMVMLSLLLQ